jgi:hypothetical protein
MVRYYEGMDVIGAGFGRTGTLSLKVALEQLGFGPCAHMLPMLDDPERAGLFTAAAGGDPRALGAALDGYRSTVDWPGAYFWRELAGRHPRAKVILTVRDPERWYDSAEKTIYAAAQEAPPSAAPALAMIQATVFQGTFGGRFADREATVRLFQDHNDAVRREIAAGRLLEFEVADGWAPLCAFLGVPVPRMPFPHLNDAASFIERVGRARSAARV